MSPYRKTSRRQQSSELSKAVAKQDKWVKGMQAKPFSAAATPEQKAAADKRRNMGTPVKSGEGGGEFAECLPLSQYVGRRMLITEAEQVNTRFGDAMVLSVINEDNSTSKVLCGSQVICDVVRENSDAFPISFTLKKDKRYYEAA